jgi:LacI family transcriptional regulator
MVTMADVASLAGVSTTTVSHVLNGTRVVAPETEEIVRQAVISTRYRHNLAARALATQSTHTIGLAMSLVTNPNFAGLVRDIERQLRAAGYTLILADTTDDSKVELDVINHLLARRVSGLIINPLEGSEVLSRSLTELLEQSSPIVFLDRRSELDGDQVYSECVDSTYFLTMHLASLGHTRIGYVCGDRRTMSGLDRLAGYRKAVDEAKLATDAELIIEGASDMDVAERAVSEHLTNAKRRASALVVSNNQMTLGVMRALRERGLKVPRDVAVICYDDFASADLIDPQLSAMAQDDAALATHVVELVLNRIKDPSRPSQTIVVPTTFHHRESCGCGRKKYRGDFGAGGD